MLYRSKFVLGIVFILLLTTIVPVFAQSEEHCVAQFLPGGRSINRGCFSTQAEAIKNATGGIVELSANANIQSVNQAIQEYNNRLIAYDITSNIVRPNATYVIAILYENTNYGGSSFTATTTISTGCQSTSYTGVFDASWDNRIDSGIGYINCNYLVMYENSDGSGSLNPCASSCSTFGVLNDNGSRINIRKTYP